MDSDLTDKDGNGLADSRPANRKFKKNTGEKALARRAKLDELEMGNIYTKDRNKMDLLMAIDSKCLLSIAEKFQVYPEQSVSLEEFVQIMEEELEQTKLKNRDDLI